LSAKAICGLGAFAKLCEMRGDQANGGTSTAKHWLASSPSWVRKPTTAITFRLAFDRPGTWSQKYNLVWDRILGLNSVPDDVLRKEMDYYRQIQNRYGLPLDNRQTYTKLDWILWTATLTQRSRGLRSVGRSGHQIPERDAGSRADDRLVLHRPRARQRGFTARPVVGGVFLQMLYDRRFGTKYAAARQDPRRRLGADARRPAP
jgi:hypothetical protein